MQRFSFGLTDLTSFDQPAGEFNLTEEGALRRGRTIARRLAKGLPEAMVAGLCVVAFDAAGNLAAVAPLGTVH